MADFNLLTPTEVRLVRGLRASQRVLRRIEIRLAIKRSRIRLARMLKTLRSLRTATDIRWHAQITASEARALESLALATSARRVVGKVLARTDAALRRQGIIQ